MALLGRELELAALDDRLRTHRVVTIIGPGGVGKTALADEAARRAAERFPMGMRRIDLTRVEAPEVVPGAIAAQLGFDSYEALLASPDDRPLLLMVDNCEHLLDAAAATIAGVIEECHLPTVLATSRSPLELPGEAVLAIAPLAVPPEGHPDPRSFPSVQLFLSRARQAGADVEPDDESAVADLCRRLDGLPLALELAAARARTLSIGDIAQRLRSGIEVLERRHFRGDRRHRSIGETIAWSYDLLGDRPARLLQTFSVFAGPFTADSARSVCAGDDDGSSAFLDDLEELVYASLVTSDTSGPDTQYRLLDTVRHFARAELEAGGGMGRTMDAFVDTVLEDALASARDGMLVWRATMISDLLAAFDNVAEALRWCNHHDEEPTRALTLCGVLWTVVHQGRADDIVVLARQTLERWPGTDHPRAGAAIATLATAEYVTGHPERGLEVAEPAIAALGTSGSAPIKLRRLVGQARSAMGDIGSAAATFADAAALARTAGMTAMAIELDIVHAHVRSVLGERVVADLERSATEARSAGSPVTEAWAQTTLGWVLLRQDPVQARVVIEEALAHCLEIDYPIGTAGNLRSLAYSQILHGEHDASRATIEMLLDDLLRRGALSDARLLVDVTAALAAAVDHPDWPMLAATARSLPVVSLLLTPGSEPVSLPHTEASPVARKHAISEAKRVLAEMAEMAEPVGAQPPRETFRPEHASHRFAPAGDVWELSYDGNRTTVRASKGMADLARLLADPEREVHCLDLVGGIVEEASTGEVIDSVARRRYEDRIRELQGEIDDAEAANDLVRADKAQGEFDAIVDHLTAAIGHGGRTRRAAGSAERARSTVTQRIRASLRRIDEVDPALGRHLQASIVTGTWCCYRPERPTRWDTEPLPRH